LIALYARSCGKNQAATAVSKASTPAAYASHIQPDTVSHTSAFVCRNFTWTIRAIHGSVEALCEMRNRRCGACRLRDDAGH